MSLPSANSATANYSKTAIAIILLFVTSTTVAAMSWTNPSSGDFSFDSDNGQDDEYSNANYTRTGYDKRGISALTAGGVNADGSIDYSWSQGRYSFQNSTGVPVVADNSFASNSFSSDPTKDGKRIIDIDIAMGQQSNPQINFSYNAYRFNPGSYDYQGSHQQLTLMGMYGNFMIQEGGNVQAQPFVIAGSAGNNDHFQSGWAMGTALCPDNDCNGGPQTNRLLIQNGLMNLDNAGWAIQTDAVDQVFRYQLSSTNSQGVPHTDSIIEYRDGTCEGEDCWTELSKGETRTFDYYSARTTDTKGEDAEGATLENTVGVGIILKITDNTSTSATPMVTHLPLIYADGGTYTVANKSCEDTGSAYNVETGVLTACDKTLYPDEIEDFNRFVPTTNRLSLDANGKLIIESRVDTDYTLPGDVNHITFDPMHYYGSNQNHDGMTDGDWDFGVDRDGCYVYDYPCRYSNEASKNEFGGTSGYNQDDDWMEYVIGDGWCDDSDLGFFFWTQAYNAGCKVSSVTGASDHWNAQAYNDVKAAMPLIDSTPGFDGAVITVGLDMQTFMSQQHTGGWDTHTIDIQMQAMPYSGAGGQGWANAGSIRGWYDTCFNGYLDVYIVPMAHWNAINDEANDRAEDWHEASESRTHDYTDTINAAGNGDGYLVNSYLGDYYEMGTQYSVSGYNPSMNAYFYEPPANPSSKELEYWSQVGPLQTDSEMLLAINPHVGQTDWDTFDPGLRNSAGFEDRPDELDGTTFNQINDYWDIEGLDQSSPYFMTSQRLGTQFSDWCINDNMDNDGEAILTIDLSGSVLNQLDDMSLTEVVSAGFADQTDSKDVEFVLMLDPVGFGGVPQKEFCWVSPETNEGDGSAENDDNHIDDDQGYNTDHEFLEEIGNSNGVGRDANTCAWQAHDEHQNANTEGDVTGQPTAHFNTYFTPNVPCVNSIPDATSVNAAIPNPDGGMVCAFVMDTAWSVDENVKFKFMTNDPPTPPPQPQPPTHNDQDRDGIFDDFDDCPTIWWPYDSGCPPTQGGNPDDNDGEGDDADNDGDSESGDDDFPGYPKEENCQNPETPDDGTHLYEDNDGDGRIDEDPRNDKDDDNDGLIDEDPWDDCPNDGLDVIFDKTFPGSVDLVFYQENSEGERNVVTGSPMVTAENESGRASGNPNKVHNASKQQWSSITGAMNSSSVNEARNQYLILHDDYATPSVNCQGLMNNHQNVYVRINVQVFVPTDDPNLQVEHSLAPYLGMWVDYGPVNFDLNGATLHSGWNTESNPSSSDKPQSSTNYGAGLGVRDDVRKDLHLGEGYYAIVCQGSVSQVTATGEQVTAQASQVVEITAVELCSNGELPVPATPEGVCTTGGGGDSALSEGLSDFWEALTGSLLALGILILILAGAAIFWFIDMKKSAVATAILGLGVALAFFTQEVDVEVGTAEAIGTIAHLAIAGAIFLYAYNLDGETNPALLSLALGIIFLWGLVHALDGTLDGGLEIIGELSDSLIPALPGAAWAITVVAGLAFFFSTLVALNVVDDPTGILDD